MCCMIYKYLNVKNGTFKYLNAPDNADPYKLLKMYVSWYNEDFIDDSYLASPIDFNDFQYFGCFAPIDFYDVYKQSR